LLCFGTDAVAVIYDMEIRLDFREERQRFAVASPITEQCQGFTDNVLGDIKSGICLNGLRGEIFGPLVVNIPRIETGVEKRCVAEEARRKRHQRPFAAEP
jgi:hypothetical protein